MKRGWWRLRVLAAVAPAMAGGGCLRPAPPKLNLTPPAPVVETFDLRPYLRAARYGHWVYERVELDTEGEPAVSIYPRMVTGGRLSEGVLEGRPMAPLDRYMRADQGRTAAARRADEASLPPLPGREEAPQLFELEEPLEAIPLDLVHTNPLETSTELRSYDRHGRVDGTGRLTRLVRLEGLQDVDCPAGHFAECLRLRVELRIEFVLGPTIDWASYVWLSREAGEVRRIEELSGYFLIFGFGSAHEYQLVSYAHDVPQSAPAEVSPKWARGLITLDRPLPRPRVSGMIIDFATTRPGQ